MTDHAKPEHSRTIWFRLISGVVGLVALIIGCAIAWHWPQATDGMRQLAAEEGTESLVAGTGGIRLLMCWLFLIFVFALGLASIVWGAYQITRACIR